jgi:protein-tyrosine phosphatase
MNPPMDFSFDWVNDQLAIGGRWPDDAVEELARREGIRAIVDLRAEDRDDEALLRRYGIDFLHLPTLDTAAISTQMLDQGVRWVRERLDRGDRVFIHCQHGVGRSALLALCTLVAGGSEPMAALDRIKAARPVVSPSPAQLEAYRSWLERYRAQSGRHFEIPSANALARVAYAYLWDSGR